MEERRRLELSNNVEERRRTRRSEGNNFIHEQIMNVSYGSVCRHQLDHDEKIEKNVFFFEERIDKNVEATLK